MSIFNLFSRRGAKTPMMNLTVLLGPASVSQPLHGRLLVNSRRRSMKMRVIDFSIAGLGDQPLPALTPWLIELVFNQARVDDYEPVSLIQYDGVDFLTGLSEHSTDTPERISSREIEFDVAAKSVGTVCYQDLRSGHVAQVDLCISALEDTIVALTPKLLEMIFTKIVAQGIMPVGLVSLRTHETEVYRPFFQHSETRSKPASNPADEVFLLSRMVDRQNQELGSEGGGIAITPQDINAIQERHHYMQIDPSDKGSAVARTIGLQVTQRIERHEHAPVIGDSGSMSIDQAPSIKQYELWSALPENRDKTYAQFVEAQEAQMGTNDWMYDPTQMHMQHYDHLGLGRVDSEPTPNEESAPQMPAVFRNPRARATVATT